MIRLFFSQETLEKFSGSREEIQEADRQYPYRKLDVLYEDEHVLFINKPRECLPRKPGRRIIRWWNI